MINTNKAKSILSFLILGICFSSNATPQNSQQGPPPKASELIKKMDTDGDGMLSSSEVKGPIADHFDDIDTNNDGLLTEEEIDNAPKPEGRPER